MNEITIEDIKKNIHKLDLIQRPYVCFIHPDLLEQIKAECSDIEKQILFEPCEFVDKDKCYLMEREKLEEYGYAKD